MNMKYTLILWASLFLNANECHSMVPDWQPDNENIVRELSLPEIFSDNMVLQQNSEVIVWGEADPNDTIIVKGTWNSQEVKTLTDINSKWKVILKTPAADNKPYQLIVKGKQTKIFNNVLLGEVWLCSGQSNMAFQTSGTLNAKEELKMADYNNIRLLNIPQREAKEPQKNVNASWNICTPENVKSFSAVAYFFGKELNQKLSVPVGLINASMGCSHIEQWINKEEFQEAPDDLIKDEFQKVPDELVFSEGHNADCDFHGISNYYNGMIAPITPYAIKGVIWYQGESNRFYPANYLRLQQIMVNQWRKLFSKDLSFYLVQIAPFKYQGQQEIGAVLVREAQLQMSQYPGCGMVVTTDIGNPDDIHPTNKQEVGRRLSLLALTNDYHKKGMVCSGPIYRYYEKINNKIEIHFDYANGGLTFKEESLPEIFIAGNDRVFKAAKAKICKNDKSVLVVWSDEVIDPIAVRYGFSALATSCLCNKEGLPASPFRTDNWLLEDY